MAQRGQKRGRGGGAPRGWRRPRRGSRLRGGRRAASRGSFSRCGAVLLPSVLLLGCLAAAGTAPAAAQADSVLVPPGPHYAAGPVHRWLLGTGYRHLWTIPIRVEVLDLARFAGGLTPLERGGGNQTRTLHMEGADGRRYIFRSVEKFVEQVLPPDLRRTFVHDLFQDHISALHPSGALAVPPLLEAAGVLHVEPRLVVMPDDPRLGEFRAEFRGMLGQIEERPNEGPDDTPGFAGSSRVVGMERLLERVDEDPEQVVASREYLAARLIDFLIGDTDRGSDQWRWAGVDRPEGGLLFRPIPRDRDWAYIRSDAQLSHLARMVFPKLVDFGPDYPSIGALTYASIHRDRHFLTDLPREVWDSVATALRERVTDEVIAEAVAGMPPEHEAREAERMTAALRARRDALPSIAARFYDRLAGEVDVRGTLEDDIAVTDIRDDGSVDVRVSSPGAAPYFERRFQPGETREVRIYLLDGDDRALVRGAGPTPITVRLIGGAGDDALADSTSAGAGRIGLYDAEGENEITARAGTRVDLDPFEPPAVGGGWIETKVTRERFRDWGRRGSVRPTADYGEGAGVIVGARATRTRYGFRRFPYARQVWLEGLYALGSGGFGMEVGGHHTWESSPWSATVLARGEQFDALRFYGFGNDAPGPGAEPDHAEALVMQDRTLIRSALTLDLPAESRVSVGLRARHVEPRPAPTSPLAAARAFGSADFGSVGTFVEAELDRTAGEGGPRGGYALEGGATLHPPVWDAPGWFGTAQAEARTYVTYGPTLALRAGSRHAWGAFPVQDAAFLGGKNTLRGFRYQRFAGDAAVYGSAELRAPVRRILLLVRGELGAFAFADAGRVFVDGASPGGWHTGYGGGLTFTSLGMTLSATYALGEEGRVYLDFGMPF